MSFTQAMQAGQPQQPGGGAQPLAAEMQRVNQEVQQMLAHLARVPGVNMAVFQQGVSMLKQGTMLVAQSMPKPQGQPGMPPGG